MKKEIKDLTEEEIVELLKYIQYLEYENKELKARYLVLQQRKFSQDDKIVKANLDLTNFVEVKSEIKGDI